MKIGHSIRLLLTVSVLALICGILSLQGQDHPGKFYVSFDAGCAMIPDTKLETIEIVGVGWPAGMPKFGFDPGVRVDVTGGYRLSSSFAAEAELGILHNSIDKFPVPYRGRTYHAPVDGSLTQVSFLLNLVFRPRLVSKLQPFVGIGVGGVNTTVDDLNIDLTPIVGGRITGRESDSGFAYQGYLGCNYKIQQSMEVGIAYKFLGTLDQEYTSEEVRLKVEPYFSHGLVVTFVFKF